MCDEILEHSILVEVWLLYNRNSQSHYGEHEPFQENNETQVLVCFLNAKYNVIVSFQVTGYHNT